MGLDNLSTHVKEMLREHCNVSTMSLQEARTLDANPVMFQLKKHSSLTKLGLCVHSERCDNMYSTRCNDLLLLLDKLLNMRVSSQELNKAGLLNDYGCFLESSIVSYDLMEFLWHDRSEQERKFLVTLLEDSFLCSCLDNGLLVHDRLSCSQREIVQISERVVDFKVLPVDVFIRAVCVLKQLLDFTIVFFFSDVVVCTYQGKGKFFLRRQGERIEYSHEVETELPLVLNQINTQFFKSKLSFRNEQRIRRRSLDIHHYLLSL